MSLHTTSKGKSQSWIRELRRYATAAEISELLKGKQSVPLSVSIRQVRLGLLNLFVEPQYIGLHPANRVSIVGLQLGKQTPLSQL